MCEVRLVNHSYGVVVAPTTAVEDNDPVTSLAALVELAGLAAAMPPTSDIEYQGDADFVDSVAKNPHDEALYRDSRGQLFYKGAPVRIVAAPPDATAVDPPATQSAKAKADPAKADPAKAAEQRHYDTARARDEPRTTSRR